MGATVFAWLLVVLAWSCAAKGPADSCLAVLRGAQRHERVGDGAARRGEPRNARRGARGEAAAHLASLVRGGCRDGGGGVADLAVKLIDANGDLVAEEIAHDAEGVVRTCLEHPGVYTLVLRMADGAGDYVVSSFMGGDRKRARRRRRAGFGRDLRVSDGARSGAQLHWQHG